MGKNKRKWVWVNANSEGLKDKRLEHFSFSFKIFNLTDLLSVSIYLIDSNNNKIILDDSEEN